MRAKLTLMVVALMLLCNAAHASLWLSFGQNPLTTTPGGKVTFWGTLENNGSSDILLNDILWTNGSSWLQLDYQSFYEYTENNYYLTPGSFYSGKIFDVAVDTVAPLGEHYGYVTFLGADGEELLPDQDGDGISDSAQFQVNVENPATPEPASALLFGAGALLFLYHKRRHPVNCSYVCPKESEL